MRELELRPHQWILFAAVALAVLMPFGIWAAYLFGIIKPFKSALHWF